MEVISNAKTLGLSTRLAVGLIAAFLFSSNATAQEETRYVLTLDSTKIDNLKTIGSLMSTPPIAALGKITSIELKLDTIDTTPLTEEPEGIEIVGNVARIYLTDALLNSLKTTPVRFKVSDGEFKMIHLVHSGGVADTRHLKTTFVEIAAELPPTIHFVRMPNNQIMSGVLDLEEKIKFETKFGEVEISVEQIDGIRFNVAKNGSAIVVMKNGDSLTGIPTLESLTLTTEWGQAVINAAFIEAITMSDKAHFSMQQKDFSSEARWTLIRR